MPDAHYHAVAEAIARLAEQWENPPPLDELARRAGMSPPHFQRVFKRFVGVSPKRFAQHLTLTRAQGLLARRATVLDAALDSGLSGPGRLHDLTVRCLAMTPAECRDRGRGLTIRVATIATPIGPALVGVAPRGLCWLGFGDAGEQRRQLRETWSNATLANDSDAANGIERQLAAASSKAANQPITVALAGTNFQMQVWRALLAIPPGRVATYGDLATSIGRPAATRAVGAACGSNRVSWLIPCHRVIGSTGTLTGYRWGERHKRALLARETAASDTP